MAIFGDESRCLLFDSDIFCSSDLNKVINDGLMKFELDLGEETLINWVCVHRI